jgi:hypothetical protein
MKRAPADRREACSGNGRPGEIRECDAAKKHDVTPGCSETDGGSDRPDGNTA